MLRTPQSKTYSRSAPGGCAAGATTAGARPTPPQSPMSSGRSGAVRHPSELDRGGMARPPARFYRVAIERDTTPCSNDAASIPARAALRRPVDEGSVEDLMTRETVTSNVRAAAFAALALLATLLATPCDDGDGSDRRRENAANRRRVRRDVS